MQYPSSIKKFLSSQLKGWDWRAVGICFVAACTFWLFNALNATHTTNLQYPIEIEYDQEKYGLIQAPKSYMQVNVTGYGWNLLRRSLGMGVKPIRVSVQTHRKDYLTGEQLTPFAVESLKEFKVNFLLEDSIAFKLDTIIAKNLPVKLNERDLLLAEGMKLTSHVMTSPEAIIIKGPSSILAQAPYNDSVRVELPRDSIRESMYREVAVKLPYHPQVKVEKSVQLRFQVAEFVRDTAYLPLKPIGFPEGMKIRDLPQTLPVQYWRRPATSPMSPESGWVQIPYEQFSPMDSTVQPEPAVSRKYLDPVCLTPKLKLHLE